MRLAEAIRRVSPVHSSAWPATTSAAGGSRRTSSSSSTWRGSPTGPDAAVAAALPRQQVLVQQVLVEFLPPADLAGFALPRSQRSQVGELQPALGEIPAGPAVEAGIPL